MKLGISSYTFNWAMGMAGYDRPKHPLTAIDLIHTAARMGAGVVQLCDAVPLATMMTSELDDLAALARGVGVDLEIGTSGTEPRRLRAFLAIATRLGARVVRTLLHAPDSSPTLVQAEGWLREVAPDYADAGVTLGVENHDRQTCRELVALVNSVDSPACGICLDTANSLGALETTEAVLRLLMPYAVEIHYKDYAIGRVANQMGFAVTGAIAGQGVVDGGLVARSLRGSGRDMNVILEMWPPFQGTVEESIAMEADWAEQSFRYLASRPWQSGDAADVDVDEDADAADAAPETDGKGEA